MEVAEGALALAGREPHGHPPSMRRFFLLVVILRLLSLPSNGGASSLPPEAAGLYQKAQETGRFFATAAKLNPEIRPTTDGKSFLLIWKGSAAPQRWIVSLHGAGKPARGFATDDLAIWHPHLQDRAVGLVCLQWWLGTGDGSRDFLTPEQIYREIDRVLQSLGVGPNTAMLHGFSRGSANSYAVAALDAGRGKRYFALNVASSGGVALDYPPNRALLAGTFGERPLTGTRWITVAGARNPQPDRDGIAGMKRTADWLKEQGAIIVESIEDPSSGHGALHLNPQNARRVLDLFLQ